MKSKKQPVAESTEVAESQPTTVATEQPKPRKRTKKATLELVRDAGPTSATAEPQPAHEPDSAPLAPEPSTEPSANSEQPKRTRARKAKPAAMTLATLAERFLAALEADGRSDATVGAYKSDLAIAQRVLGAETAIDSIRPADIARFNDSEPVTLSRSGAPKASPTVERTRRVLRLALDHAECEGWIEVSPCGCEIAEIEA